jgi:hypothetical protein
VLRQDSPQPGGLGLRPSQEQVVDPMAVEMSGEHLGAAVM